MDPKVKDDLFRAEAMDEFWDDYFDIFQNMHITDDGFYEV